jgi:predicted RNA-binding protein with PIN domain
MAREPRRVLPSALRMPWLVDGMNVIGSRPDGWWRDRTGAMRRLVRSLQDVDDDDVWVVLDGRERDLGDSGRVRVVWAPEPGPNAADRVIAGLVEEDADPARWRVVTSDAALADRVRAAGASVTGAREFRERLG